MRSTLTTLLALLPAAFTSPILSQKRQVNNPIPGSWIVRLDEDAILAQSVDALASGAGVNTTYSYGFQGFKGFAFNGTEADVDNLLETLPAVKYVEPDSVVSIDALVSQTGATWGLGRISHRSRGSTTYIYDSSAGSGTYAYVIDTGINTAHSQFGGRASIGANLISGESSTDGNGHGTHVSGTIGGSTYGVAKQTTLIGVKVLSSSGSGSNSGVIAGIEWAVNNAQSNGRTGRSVINLFLGSDSFSQTSNDAVTAAVNAGVFVAVAAGNAGVDARNGSPGSAPAVCTVGATDINDAKASFSNYGPVVDIYAPGVNVLSAWIGSTTATNTISGTSMASPHIAGLGAYLIALEGTRTPAALCSRIQTLSTKSVITSIGSGSVNDLAYNGNGA